MFPLNDEELRAKGDELAGKIGEVEQLEDQKDAMAAKFNEAIKKAKAEIKQLATEIRARQAEREASAEEAPWAPTLERAQAVAGRARRRRDRTGEMVEDGE
jgi:peptidoglycan hydrolase CwlO-like protein